VGGGFGGVFEGGGGEFGVAWSLGGGLRGCGGEGKRGGFGIVDRN
jgi:hypothetical protein